jgi:parallel beta-helix repeat protein
MRVISLSFPELSRGPQQPVRAMPQHTLEGKTNMEMKQLVRAWSVVAACTVMAPWAVTVTHAQSVAGEPFGLNVQSNTSSTQALLQWSSTDPTVTSFAVERRLVGSRIWGVLATLPAAQRQYRDSGLLNLRGYEYRVRAYLTGGPAAGAVSAASVIVVTPSANALQSNYDVAATPRNVDAQAVSGTEIIVTWADVTPDETNFKVERRQGNGHWSAIALPAADATLYRDTGLTAGQSYEYRVSAERPGLLAVPSAGTLASTPAVSTLLRYVDGCIDNGTAAGAGTLASPWRALISAGFADLAPGTTVLVRNRANCSQPTVYRSIPNASGTVGSAVLNIGNDIGQGQFATGGRRSGTAAAWITFRNYPGERPKIRSTRNSVNPTTGAVSNGNFNGISVRNVSYIVIQGFEIEGHLNDVPYAEAEALNAAYKAGTITSISSVLDSSGITVGFGVLTAANVNQLSHHIVLRDNIIYNHPGGGISAQYVDWITMENNRVSNVGAYSPYGASALNIYRAKDVDSNTSDYKMIIRGNIASEAQNLFPCRCVAYTKQTDGNGIILDQLNDATFPAAFGGKTLVTGNIVTNNGGRGIHVFQSANADVVSNTAVNNSQIAITGDGEITSQQSRNVRVYNNIMVARSDRPTHWINFANAAAKAAFGSTVDFNNNILFGGNPLATQVTVSSTNGDLATGNRLNLDPRFVGGAGFDRFRLAGHSPAVDTAAATAVAAPMTDVFLAPRPRGLAGDVGAVESF